MKKLKVLHINTLDSFGGASQVVIDLLDHMNADSHLTVRKKVTGNPKAIELKKNVFDIILELLDKIIWKFGYRKSLRNFLSLDNEGNRTYSKLKKLKEYSEADIIHLHNLHGGYFDFSTFQEIAKEKKIVWTLHDMWSITGGEAYTFENENYKKGIGSTPYIDNYPLLSPIVDRRQHFLEKKKLIYKKIHDALTIVPASDWLDKCFHESYVYDSCIQLKRIHNGIDTSTFRNQQLRKGDRCKILFFNLNNPFKGSQLFINIANRIEKEFELLVVGEKLKTNIPYSHFNYINDRKELNKIYNQADVLIFPSLAENFPLTVLEAMACGVCVIASETGGIPEMLDNSCGFLFRNNDEKDLLNTINTALSDRSMIRKKGELAEQRVLKNFTIGINCRHYLNLYHEILKYHDAEWLDDDLLSGAKQLKISDFFIDD